MGSKERSSDVSATDMSLLQAQPPHSSQQNSAGWGLDSVSQSPAAVWWRYQLLAWPQSTLRSGHTVYPSHEPSEHREGSALAVAIWHSWVCDSSKSTPRRVFPWMENAVAERNNEKLRVWVCFFFSWIHRCSVSSSCEQPRLRTPEWLQRCCCLVLASQYGCLWCKEEVPVAMGSSEVKVQLD